MVERTFGSIKRWFNSKEARYIGKEKMHTQHLLEAIAYNLKRMPRLYYENNTSYAG
jgi:IS5 family transposase